MMPEQDPFVAAFAQYLDAVQEVTCNGLLGRKGGQDRLEAAGERLIEATGPSMKKSAKLAVAKIKKLRENKNDGPVSEAHHSELMDAAQTLMELKPALEENDGLVFLADTGQIHAGNFLELYLGEGVKVEHGCLSATLLFEPVVELTRNRFFRESKSDARMKGWTCSDGSVYYDFKSIAGCEKSTRKLFEGPGNGGPDGRQVQLRKLAYGSLLGKFGDDDEEAFGMESGLALLGCIAPHEYYHQNIIGNSEVEMRIEEAGACLYSLMRTTTPESLFADMCYVDELKNHFDEAHRAAAPVVKGYLDVAGCPEDAWAGVEPKDAEKVRAFCAQMQAGAKEALKSLERDYGLPSHEDAERELRPDFGKYGKLVRGAVAAHYAGRGVEP